MDYQSVFEVRAQAGEIAGKSVEGEMAATGVPCGGSRGRGARATRAMRYASDMSSRRLPASDGALIQIVDAALADAARRSGEWLVCRPGCTQCCVGVFAINQLDAVRLQQGLAELELTDAARAGRIRTRARDSVRRLSAEFPGNARTGVLDEGPEAEVRGICER